MTMREKVQQVACDALDAGKPVQDMADAVALAALREVLALDYHSAEGMRMQVERWLAEFSPRPEPAAVETPRAKKIMKTAMLALSYGAGNAIDKKEAALRDIFALAQDHQVDTVCPHGTAMDVHCCACQRSGFFPPENCHCTPAAPETPEPPPLSCPTCESPNPNFHPATSQGEVTKVCSDAWHNHNRPASEARPTTAETPEPPPALVQAMEAYERASEAAGMESRREGSTVETRAWCREQQEMARSRVFSLISPASEARPTTAPSPSDVEQALERHVLAMIHYAKGWSTSASNSDWPEVARTLVESRDALILAVRQESAAEIERWRGFYEVADAMRRRAEAALVSRPSDVLERPEVKALRYEVFQAGYSLRFMHIDEESEFDVKVGMFETKLDRLLTLVLTLAPPVQAPEGRTLEPDGWSIEVRYGAYQIVDGVTRREYHAQIYEGSHTEASASAAFDKARAALLAVSRG